MTDADVHILRRELERAKRKLDASLKLNSVLENANRELERLNRKTDARQDVICGDVVRVRGMVRKLRSYSEFTTTATITESYEPPLSLMAKEESSAADVHRDPHAVRSQQVDELQCNNCRKVFKFKAVLEGHRRFCGDTKEKVSLASRERMKGIDNCEMNSQTSNIPSAIKSIRTLQANSRAKPWPKFKIVDSLAPGGRMAIEQEDYHEKKSHSASFPMSTESLPKFQVLGRSKPLPKFKKCPYCPYVTVRRNWAKHVKLHSKPNFRSQPKLWKGRNLAPSSATIDLGHNQSSSTPALDAYEPPLSLVAAGGPSWATGNREHPAENRGLGKLQCSNCSKVFKFKSVLEGHRRFCGGVKQAMTKSHHFTASTSKAKSFQQNLKTFECEYEGCDFRTRWNHSLKLHVQCVHEGNRPWACGWEECDMTFKTRKVRDEHVRRIHTGERPFGCSDCDKWFAAGNALAKHRQSQVHLNQVENKKVMARSVKPKISNAGLPKPSSDPKPFECHYDGCEFKARHSSTLKIHVQCVHEDHRPFVCEWPGCDLAFKMKRNFEDHVRGVHTGERPFGCELCDLWFAAKKNLFYHLKTKKHLERI